MCAIKAVMSQSLNVFAIVSVSILGALCSSLQTRERFQERAAGIVSTSSGYDSSGMYYSCTCDPGTRPHGRTFNIYWSGNELQNFVGTGWNPGSSSRTIHYQGNYNVSGNSFLSVYGWTRSPLIEYHIVEIYGAYNPGSAASLKGSVSCDGASYDTFQTTRTNQPSIDGTQTYQQFWSVRNPKKSAGDSVSGVVTTSCHFNAWRNYGMNLGSQHNYQLVSIEGSLYSSGTATITVS